MQTKLGIVNSEKEIAVKESYAIPNSTWLSRINRFFFLKNFNEDSM